MKVSDIVAKILREQGFCHVFAISGGASLHLIHSIAETPGLNLVCPQHEQAGAMAADAYSRLTSGRGCAVATSGPGATNLITGIASAYYDSVPVLFLTGNVARFRDKGDTGVRQMGFQETEFVEMCRSITNYAVKISDARSVKRELLEALYRSRQGRPGPVVVDIPDDIQRADVEEADLDSWTSPAIKGGADQHAMLAESVEKIVVELERAARPCIVLGWGVHLAEAEEETMEIVEEIGAPVVTTWAAADLMPHDHPLCVGSFGTHGTRYANFCVQNADFILSIGSRLDSKATGSPPSTFARGAKIAMVDIDPAELGKFNKLGRYIDVPVCASIGDFLPLLKAGIEKSKLPDILAWRTRVVEWKEKYPQLVAGSSSPGAINPYYLAKTISDLLEPGDIVVSETGCALAWMMQGFEFKPGQRFFHAFNFTPMGWGLPASIGAALARPGRRIVLIAGDGSLQMNLQELVTVTKHDLPIKVLLFNNHGHGMVQQTQEMWLGSKYYATSIEGGLAFPDFEKVAQAYGYPVFSVSRNEKLRATLSLALSESGYSFTNIEIAANERVVPQVQFGRPNEDSSPLLDRKEFMDNMLVEPLAVSQKA
ncbi:MAG: thiamine pyrophosphate-binding protein [Chthoniobacterales bacterium]|jgi:acetolactate synthase I/II/III large subunit